MSAQYLLPCTCGQKIRVSLSQAGGQAACACGKSLAIPTLRGIRQLDIAPATATAGALGWSKLHGAFFSGGVLIAAIGAAIIAYHLLLYAQIGGLAVDRTDEVLRSSSEQIDTLTPLQSLEVWSHEMLEEGLGEPQTPYWIAAKQKVDEYFAIIKMASVALLLGSILALLTMFVGRR